jgi:hypothetical protein
MPRSLLRLLPVLLAGVLAAACGDAPTDPPAAETATLGFSLNNLPAQMRLMVVEVTAPDIPHPLVYDINLLDGTAVGRIDVPAGLARTIHVRAYDMNLAQSHEGSATMDVKPGSNPPVTVTLTPAAGHVPLSVNFGSLVVMVHAVDGPNAPTGEYMVGSQARFEATVIRADGTPVPGAAVRWASLNPGVASVTPEGMVTALNEGTTEIAVTYNGYGASVPVGVTARTDFYPPTVSSMAFDPTSVAVSAGASRTIRLNMALADDVSGLATAWVEIRGTVRHFTGWNCDPAPAATPGTYTCTYNVTTSLPADEYVVTGVHLTDNTGNSISYTKADLAARGIAPKLAVTHN